MKRLAIAALGIALLALASACGGDGGEVTVEDYFQHIETLIDDFAGQIDALGDLSEDDVAWDEEAVDLVRDYTRAFAALWRDSVEEFRNIEPPAQVAAAHEEALEARDDRARAYEDLAEQVKGVGSLAELETVLAQMQEDDPFTPAEERLKRACLKLQRIAEDSGIDVELRCITFTVQGSAMSPTMPDGARATVREYRYEMPARGDVVVFKAPNNPEREFLKRIIGEPDDTVRIDNGTVFVNGAVLEDSYVINRGKSNYGPETVPPGHYFVLGDNRANSYDSRAGWTVPEENIIGRVVAVDVQ